MSFHPEFPNIPCEKLGGKWFMDPTNFPEGIVLTRNGKKKSHIMWKEDLEETEHRAWKEGVAFCDRRTKRVTTEMKTIDNSCSDCISHFNEVMKYTFYDSQEEQWYFPERQ